MTDKVICYYHNDMDGIASASIVMKVYPNAKFIGVNYEDTIHRKDIKDSIVIIVDFSFSNEIMKSIIKDSKQLVWIDHHRTAMENNKSIWEDEAIDGLRDLSLSGCELTWNWFFPRALTPRSLKLIGDRDLWKFKYEEDTKAYHEYGSLEFRRPNIKLLDEEFTAIAISRGKILRVKKQIQIRRSFEQGSDVIFEGHKTRLINTNFNVSETGEFCYKNKYPIAFIWSVRKDKIICSLRSDTIDVGKIAEKYGGGGHKFAAGFHSSFPAIRELIKNQARR